MLFAFVAVRCPENPQKCFQVDLPARKVQFSFPLCFHMPRYVCLFCFSMGVSVKMQSAIFQKQPFYAALQALNDIPTDIKSFMHGKLQLKSHLMC